MSDHFGNLVDKVEVFEPEEKKPVLYDAKERPIYRRIGFQSTERRKGDK